MNDVTNTETDQLEMPELEAPTELDMLKQRARIMGITFSNNIGVDALKKRIEEKLSGEAQADATDTDEDETENQGTLPLGGTIGSVAQVVAAVEAEAPKSKKPLTKLELRKQIRDENLKLIRLRITNLDPKKKDLPGEIFTVANSFLGTVRKYVPFGEQTDNGYHVPYCIYKMMRNRKFLSIKVKKLNGREHIEQQWVREFALDILPPLTATEIAQLATAQQAAAGN